MEGNPVLQAIVKALEASEDIEGAFIFGSIATQHRDAFSDVEIGIVAKNTAEAFANLTKASESLLSAIGKPVQVIHEVQKRTESAAALYGKDQFPPIGLEVKVIYGQLRYLQEMLPYTDTEILVDKGGKLAPALEKLRRTRPADETAKALKAQIATYAFVVQDALKAYEREADFDLQAVLEDLRERIFYAAAARFGGQVDGAKRASKFLSAEEHQLIAESYQAPTLDTIKRLNELYACYLDELKTNFAIGDGADGLRETLKALV
ncbi:MAG: nucleotidyltransferase domain-containing protein [Chloroflexota bacterium]